MRRETINFGCVAGVTFPPISGKELKRTGIPGGYKRAWRLGKAIFDAYKSHKNPIQVI